MNNRSRPTKYHTWTSISPKLRGILYPLTDDQSIQEILDELFDKLNKDHPECHYRVKRVCVCGKVKPFTNKANRLSQRLIEQPLAKKSPASKLKGGDN